MHWSRGSRTKSKRSFTDTMPFTHSVRELETFKMWGVRGFCISSTRCSFCEPALNPRAASETRFRTQGHRQVLTLSLAPSNKLRRLPGRLAVQCSSHAAQGGIHLRDVNSAHPVDGRLCHGNVEFPRLVINWYCPMRSLGRDGCSGQESNSGAAVPLHHCTAAPLHHGGCK